MLVMDGPYLGALGFGRKKKKKKEATPAPADEVAPVTVPGAPAYAPAYLPGAPAGVPGTMPIGPQPVRMFPAQATSDWGKWLPLILVAGGALSIVVVTAFILRGRK